MTDTPATAPITPEINDLIKENAELQRSLGEVKRQMASRIVMAELKAEAVRAGIIDLDALRMLDVDSVKLDDEQNVHGVTEMVVKLKEQKPYLFQGKSSSVVQAAPPAKPLVRKLATEMNDEEYQVARTALLKQFR